MNMNRRNLMLGMTGLAVTAAAPAPRKTFFRRIGKPIGLQLYTLGEDPAKDLDGTLAKVAAIGYRDLELPSLLGKTPEVLKAAADKVGLRYSSIHLPGQAMDATSLSLLSEPQKIADTMGVLGITDAVMPIVALPASFRTAAGNSFQEKIANALSAEGPDLWKKTAALLNERATALKSHGIRVGYHNHNVEFATYGKTTGWDILVKETDPRLVYFEIDLGWIAAAGHDPAAFLTKHKGRVRWIHVKDVKATTKTNFALNMDPTEIGSGKLDWSRILPAAKAAGVEHYFVEQEPPFTMARIDAAARSFGFLNKLV